MTDKAISPLRRRMIEDVTIRKLRPKTQAGDIRVVENFTAFLGHSPDRGAGAGTAVATRHHRNVERHVAAHATGQR
jgi:hypothetical protein